jgi:hypothetical protein
MRWIKPNLRNSIYSLLGGPPPPVSESTLESRTEEIRQAMLDVLGQVDTADLSSIQRRIRFASDIEALWYLRGDLMATLSAGQGELAARDQIGSLTLMFDGLLPHGLKRPRSRATV